MKVLWFLLLRRPDSRVTEHGAQYAVAHDRIPGSGSTLSASPGAAQTGVAGSARLGHRIIFGGQVGVRDHAAVGDDVKAGARTAIHHDVPSNSTVLGMPARDWRRALREQAAVSKLPELIAQVKKLKI